MSRLDQIPRCRTPPRAISAEHQTARENRAQRLGKTLIASPFVFGIGGVAVAIKCISQQFSQCGGEVEHLTRGKMPYITRSREAQDFKTYGINTRLPNATLRSWSAFLCTFPLVLICTIAFLVKHRFDRIWIVYPVPGHIVLAIASRILGKQVYVTFQGSDAHGLTSHIPVHAFCLRLVLRLATRVTAVSQSLAYKVHLFYPSMDAKQIAVIPNGTPSSAFEKNAIERSSKQGIRIVAVGKLIPRKGFDLLVRSMAIVSVSLPEVKCKIIGEGQEYDNLQKMIFDLGLKEKLELVGSMDHESVLLELKSSDIFVLSSHAEGAALVLAEAMACRCAVVSTAVDGALDLIVDSQNGVLVEVANVEQLAIAIEKLVCDTQLRQRISENGYNTSRHLCWEHVTELYLELMKSCSQCELE